VGREFALRECGGHRQRPTSEARLLERMTARRCSQIGAGFETHVHVWPLSGCFRRSPFLVNGLPRPVRLESKDTCKPNTVTDPRVAFSIS
jgi:hypothetical protein